MFSDEIIYYQNLKRFGYKSAFQSNKNTFLPLFFTKKYKFDHQRLKFDTYTLKVSNFEISGLNSKWLDILILFIWAFQAPNGFNGHSLFSFRHF